MLNSIIRVDLHIHSYISKYKEGVYEKTDPVTGEKKDINIVEESKPENLGVLFNKLQEHKINLFAFSDHNRFDKDLFLIAKDKLENDKKEEVPKWPEIKNILPSAEFDVLLEEGKIPCHILTIFDYSNESDLDKITRAIDNDKITSDSGYYELNKFENLLKSIGLSTILIAAQRKSMDNPKPYARSYTDSIDNSYEFLKVGFINALEYQNSKVEGMIINNLKDFPKSIPLVTGSDCHTWEFYPKHDINDKNKDKTYYFEIKALPTFLGLLFSIVSPETRFKRFESSNKYLKTFNLNNNAIELDPGINVIIGENGSGKSTLLTGLLTVGGNSVKEGYMKTLLNKNGFKADSSLKCESVEQNGLIDMNNKNKMFLDEFGHVNTENFKNSINNYANGLLSYLEFNIKKQKTSVDLAEKSLKIDSELYFKKSYYISVVDFNFEDSLTCEAYKNRLHNLNKITLMLKAELKSEVYSKAQKDKIQIAIDNIMEVRKDIIALYKQAYLSDSLKNLISEKSKEYVERVKELSSTLDAKALTYRNEVSKLSKDIANYINKFIYTNNKYPSLDINNIGGINRKISRGYKFVTKAEYFDNKEALEEKLISKIFVKGYSNRRALDSIDTDEKLISAISGCTKSKYKEVYNKSVANFINEMSKEEKHVQTLEDEAIGNTLGERSLVYYKYITNEVEAYDILFIDQPEDNISNIRIKNDLIKYLQNVRNKKQVIFVTHNPLLVINMDVDNVIIMKKQNQSLLLQNGCLEDGDILDSVANLLDGGKEIIEKRLKLYYGR